MEKFIKGDVVVLPFPFSDLTEAKRRPALVLSELDGADRILCQITSQKFGDRYAVSLEESDFGEGSLRKSSNIRLIRSISGCSFARNASNSSRSLSCGSLRAGS